VIPQIVQIIIWIIIFCVVAYGMLWVCQRFGLPQPVLWLCGALLLIVLLLFVASQFAGAGTSLFTPHALR
jgi:hypothetical protein